jgi:hypothetical protein
MQGMPTNNSWQAMLGPCIDALVLHASRGSLAGIAIH